ncbi:hypothetical protein [Chamaesiphon minutus]|uniref:Uncharacterized protein n=1 Tax=Chamaesiphon minutus (strain ATCC 27169 / PCC 6605) TaxID=1173020 RepID=K9UNF8_CHAP6|nr:hypothetical protein [Chamaesiphon minutus]AFY96208.1 hypothetical protein Cha6605_5321 [Chamaesiphon minutus PCC 6605]
MRDRLERIESVKAGSLGGIAAGIGYGLMLSVARFLQHEYSRSFVSLGLEVAIALVSGFLFGVTYRYIIRTDRNNHLNSGAVLAFGLVRGLAQVDVSEFELSQVWIDGLIVGQSLAIFAISRYAIDYALNANWVLPFTQQSQPEVITIDLSEPTLSERKFTTNSIDGLPK